MTRWRLIAFVGVLSALDRGSGFAHAADSSGSAQTPAVAPVPAANGGTPVGPAAAGTTDFSNWDDFLDVPEVYRPFWKGRPSFEAAAALLAKLPYERITMEYGPGMGGGSSPFRLVFLRSGTAELENLGRKNSGPNVSFVAPENYARLCYLIERNRFESMRADYIRRATDQRMVTVSVIGASGTKTVKEYGKVGPIELWAIQEAIFALKAEIWGREN